jgi:hypothetical protein
VPKREAPVVEEHVEPEFDLEEAIREEGVDPKLLGLGESEDAEVEEETEAEDQPEVEAAAEEPEEEEAVEEEPEGAPDVTNLQAQINRLKGEKTGLERDISKWRSMATESQDLLARLEGRLDDLAGAKAKAEEPQPPDPEEDPVGHLGHTFGRALEGITQRLDRMEGKTDANANANNQATLISSVEAREEAFRAEHPDYDEAYEHLETIRSGFLPANLSDEERKAALDTTMAAFVTDCVGKGIDPVQAVYEQAQRTGFATKEAAAEDGNGDKPEAEDKPKKKAKKATRKATSLSQASGGGGAGHRLTVDMVDEFSDADWREIVADPEKMEKLAVEGKL